MVVLVASSLGHIDANIHLYCYEVYMHWQYLSAGLRIDVLAGPDEMIPRRKPTNSASSAGVCCDYRLV